MIKKFYLLFSTIIVFVIHLLFVFARVKPVEKNASNITLKSTENLLSNNLQFVPAEIPNIYDSLKLGTLGLSKQAFDYAVKGFNYLLAQGKLVNNNILSIVDFSETSNKKRLFIIDLKNYKILFNTYVAQDRKSVV